MIYTKIFQNVKFTLDFFKLEHINLQKNEENLKKKKLKN